MDISPSYKLETEQTRWLWTDNSKMFPTVNVELETTLQHPQHILEEVSDDEILNVEEEISENEENESFDDEEWDDNENEITEEKE
uniref:Uncharacterized protein n=1 Tax=Solanum tuberosum TaxID=4113 RepID=M1DWL4_SOLTU